jgi:glycosyltransferase involved in cell wall biosynthesis
MSKPAVTVIIDTYNHERFIEEAIVSVLEQDFPQKETEIILVDDGSTDRTPEIARKFEPRIRVIQKPNGGQASAFNAAIPQAGGEFTAFLDGDDWWAQNKLSRALATFEKEPDLGFVGHGDTLVYPDGRRMLHVLREGCRFEASTLEGARLFRVRGSFLGTSRMTVRTRILQAILPVPEMLRVQADEYLFTIAACSCAVRILPESLFFYRLHDANGFQMIHPDASRLRQKQRVLSALATSLRAPLKALAIDEGAFHAILEMAQAHADQLRLSIDGGWPWETVKVEWTTYRIIHPDAPFSHRGFKALILLAALAMPPRSFYSLQRQLSQSAVYRRARKRWLPIPEMSHIHKDWRTGV